MIYKTIWISLFTAVLIWSGIHPKDSFTWFLEVLPALIGAAILAATYNQFKFTPLLYTLMLLHSIVLMVGGHYTYAEVPLFDWLKEPFGWERNNYDKVGHFFQGFVPALIAHELFIRMQIVKENIWLPVLAISVALAFSAFYELIEWWVALASGEGAEAFLGTQGYEWDTQSDMGWALLGAILALLFLSKYHKNQINALIGKIKT